MPHERFEVALFGAEMQDAARQGVVLDSGPASELAQAPAAVGGQPGQRPRVALEAPRNALAQKTQPPPPLRPVGARPEKQRRILAAQPAQDLGDRLGPGPRLS